MAKNKKLKKAAVLGAALCLIAAFFPVPVTAAGAEDGYGDVTFNFHVDATLANAEMCMYFMDTETLEIRTVTTDEYKSGTVTESMPYGTYEFGYATFDGDISFNYASSMSCGTFTVSEEGTTYDDGGSCAVISTVMRVVVSVPITCAFDVESSGGAVVQMRLSGESDAVYAEGPPDIPQQEEYSIVAEKGMDAVSIDAGTYTVTDIRAYGENHEPLSVYYPARITVDREEGLERGQEYALYAMTDDELDAMAKGDRERLSSEGYRLMLSTDVPEYETSYYDKKIVSYDIAAGLSDGTAEAEADIDVSGFTVEDGDYPEYEDAGNAGERRLWPVIAAAAAVFAAFAVYIRRSRKR